MNASNTLVAGRSSAATAPKQATIRSATSSGDARGDTANGAVARSGNAGSAACGDVPGTDSAPQAQRTDESSQTPELDRGAPIGCDA